MTLSDFDYVLLHAATVLQCALAFLAGAALGFWGYIEWLALRRIDPWLARALLVCSVVGFNTFIAMPYVLNPSQAKSSPEVSAFLAGFGAGIIVLFAMTLLRDALHRRKNTPANNDGENAGKED